MFQGLTSLLFGDKRDSPGDDAEGDGNGDGDGNGRNKKKKTKTESSSSTAAGAFFKKPLELLFPRRQVPTDRSPSLLAEVMQEALWTDYLESCLEPVEVASLAGVSTALRHIHARDTYWRKVVERIDGGDSLKAIRAAHTLDFPPHSLMRTYLAYISDACNACGGHLEEVYIDTLRLVPTCYDCCAAWAATGLMEVKHALFVYMLVDADVEACPRLDVYIDDGFGHQHMHTTVVAREAIEWAAKRKYGSLEGLRAAKVKAREIPGHEWELKWATYQATKKAAEAQGLRAPLPPSKPRVLCMPLDITPDDTGVADWLRDDCVAAVLYEPEAMEEEQEEEEET